jgi:hypothetical protein
VGQEQRPPIHEHDPCAGVGHQEAAGPRGQEPSTRLYRGLGGLKVDEFVKSCGFTDKAFMSTTKSRKIALKYSGVKKGLVGTVVCIETSTTNNGDVISEFSQYPGEDETVWNACSFLQHLPGRDEVVPGTGMVRIYHVLVSANSRAETVEELEGRRKRVVVQVLDTLYADVCRTVDAAVKTAEFKARVSQDKNVRYKDRFINSIKNESAERVAVYKALPDGATISISAPRSRWSVSLCPRVSPPGAGKLQAPPLARGHVA